MSVINTRYGKFNTLDGDTVISHSLKLYGEWAQHEINLIAYFIQPGSVVVDAGAFIGTHARAFSTLVGKSGKVLAFEPRRNAVEIMNENAKLSPIGNVSVINSALGAAERKLTVAITHANSNINYGALTLEPLISQDDSGEEITVTTLDAYKFERLDFVKIDVEGMELDVLKGAVETIERCRPVIFVECNSLEGGVPIIKWCKDKNYQVYGVLSSAYNAANFAGYTANIFGASQEVGMLLIPCESHLQYEKVLLSELLPQINTVDDLALLLLHKPQYPYEVFAHSKVAEILTLGYPSQQAEMLNHVVTERDKQVDILKQGLLERDKQVDILKQGLLERDEQIKYMSTSILYRFKKSMFNRFYNLLKRAYKNFPCDESFKRRTKNFFFSHTPFLFNRFPGYKNFREEIRWKSELVSKYEPTLTNFSEYLPSYHENFLENHLKLNVELDVVIPVYDGYLETIACIDSVLGSKNNSVSRVIVVNDKSPDELINLYLKSLQDQGLIVLIENNHNQGFVYSVNLGMAFSRSADVILLNSDTEVSDFWLDKLKMQAYTNQNIGTVTPFTNNGTICNYPTPEGMERLPPGETVQSLNEAFFAANYLKNIQIPTAVGFCMYLKRDCIKDVGYFDEKTFGLGYGEENDFCLRASKKSWTHILAADTFVYHKGGVSFGAKSNARKVNAQRTINKLYPEYEALISSYMAKKEILPLAIAATAARFNQSKDTVVLHIAHALGGGTKKYLDELHEQHSTQTKILVMQPLAGEIVAIRCINDIHVFDLSCSLAQRDFLILFLKSFGIALLHIHHLFGFHPAVRGLIKGLSIPFYLTIHDYMLICPRITMVDVSARYCGEKGIGQCNSCLADGENLFGATDIYWWRESNAWLFNEALRVICPSGDVKARCEKYFPNANYQVTPHESFALEVGDINVRHLGREEPIRVAIIGVLAKHKGLNLISDAILELNQANFPITFELIGKVDDGAFLASGIHLSQTGEYQDDFLLEEIDRINPHIILLPSICPETYSYTLTRAILSQRPIVATNIGAFVERLSGRKWTWLIDYQITGKGLVNEILRIREQYFLAPEKFQFEEVKSSQLLQDSSFYKDQYFNLIDHNNPSPRDLRSPGRVAALVVVELIGHVPSPCAYIRLISPLFKERNDQLDIYFISADQIYDYSADVLITQRTAITSISEVHRISKYCTDKQIKIIYDIDDYLLELPETHPHAKSYSHKSSSVLLWLVLADEVWVSTQELKAALLPFNSNIKVFHNLVDEDIWIPQKGIKEKESVNILYMGTPTHDDDFELIKDALIKLKNEFGNLLQISLVGVLDGGQEYSWCNRIDLPYSIHGAYPAFVRWINKNYSFDIGVAPLVNNLFNRCKSDIKFLDYSMMGLASVVSDVACFDSIRHGINGFKVKNVDEWYGTLKDLIHDKELRNKIKDLAQKNVIEERVYRCILGKRRQSLLALHQGASYIRKNIPITELDPQSCIDRNMIASAFLVGKGIEIGALHNPLPLPPYATVKYVDRFEKSGLYEQYPELRGLNLVSVDIVDNGESLLTFEDSSQDFIVANHFLEHCEDPIATLKTFERVLRVGGVIFLALPDKRHTFDVDRQRTTLDHLISDHINGPQLSRYTHFEEWPRHVEPHFGRSYSSEEMIADRANELLEMNYSIHFHVWEPADAYELIQYITEKEGVKLSLEYFHSRSDEMLIILKKIV